MITISVSDSAGHVTTQTLNVVVDTPPTSTRKVWCLQQTPVVSSQINSAMALSEVTGFSVRFPWRDHSDSMLNSAYALRNGKDFSLRFMAGRHTPEDIILAGPHYNSDDGVSPTPFNSNGSPNLQFEAAYEDFCNELADWAVAHGVKLLHLSWYAQAWAELNHGAEVRAQPGYSYANWLNSHKRLVDIGYRVWQAHPSLTIEWPLSGYGPISGNTPAAKDLANYMISKWGAGSDDFRGQANGWGPNGVWGASTATTENQLTSEVKPINFKRGIQAIQPTTNWTDAQVESMLDELTEWTADYCELYTPTLLGASGTKWNNAIANHPWINS